MYLLDTNIVSNLVRADNRQVRSVFLAKTATQCRISVFSEGEILFGLAKKLWPEKLTRNVRHFLGQLEILSWTSQEARIYGQLRANLAAKGRSLSDLDMLIAAHALSTDHVLVSADKAFGNIPGLLVEDWTA